MEQIMCMKMDFALNKLQCLIYHKTKPNQTKPNQYTKSFIQRGKIKAI